MEVILTTGRDPLVPDAAARNRPLGLASAGRRRNGLRGSLLHESGALGRNAKLGSRRQIQVSRQPDRRLSVQLRVDHEAREVRTGRGSGGGRRRSTAPDSGPASRRSATRRRPDRGSRRLPSPPGDRSRSHRGSPDGDRSTARPCRGRGWRPALRISSAKRRAYWISSRRDSGKAEGPCWRTTKFQPPSSDRLARPAALPVVLEARSAGDDGAGDGRGIPGGLREGGDDRGYVVDVREAVADEEEAEAARDRRRKQQRRSREKRRRPRGRRSGPGTMPAGTLSWRGSACDSRGARRARDPSLSRSG